RKYGSPPRTCIFAIKLSEDNDKRIPIDGDTYDLEPVLRLFSGECIDHLIAVGDASKQRTAYVTPSYLTDLVAIGHDEVQEFATANNNGGRVNIIAETASKNFEALIHG
ncbi:unnamed protein product, partial [marine sediment metagenome]